MKCSTKDLKINFIAAEIRRKRAQLRITQATLAELVGTSRENIAKYEGGFSMPPANLYARVIMLPELAITPDEAQAQK